MGRWRFSDSASQRMGERRLDTMSLHPSSRAFSLSRRPRSHTYLSPPPRSQAVVSGAAPYRCAKQVRAPARFARGRWSGTASAPRTLRGACRADREPLGRADIRIWRMLPEAAAVVRSRLVGLRAPVLGGSRSRVRQGRWGGAATMIQFNLGERGSLESARNDGPGVS